MEVTIGVIYTAKELSVEVEGSADDLVKTFEAALTAGAPLVWLTDTKGMRVGVPADKVAYVEIKSDDGNRHVGFGKG